MNRIQKLEAEIQKIKKQEADKKILLSDKSFSSR